MKALILSILGCFVMLYCIVYVKTNGFSKTPTIPSKEYNIRIKSFKSKDSLYEGDMFIIKRDTNNNVYVEPATLDDARYYLESNGEG